MEQEPQAGSVVATYEEIRERFGLGGTDQARIKAKRRKWPLEPRNDPGALARVRVPREEWDLAGRSPDQYRSNKALEGIVRTFQEERDRIRIERDAARTELFAERARVVQAEREREEARIRAAAAEGEVRGVREALDQARQELAEARRPFWRRWLG
jgi:hypothetical protein